MNIRFFRIFSALLLVVILISACSGGGASSAPKEPLRVEYTQWWPDYTLIVAKEKGFFDKAGVNVEPVYYANFPQALTDLPAGKIDGALYAIGDALVISQSIGLKVVAAYDDGGYNTVVARPDIASIADLKGQQVGVLIGSSYELFVRQMIKSAGLGPSDVKLVNVDPSEVPQRLSKDIAAGFVWFPDEAVAQGNHVIYQKEDAPGLFPDVIVFSEDVVKSRPDDIRAFLKAWFEAVEYRKQNPEEVREIVAKYTGLPLEQIMIDDQIHIMNLQDNQASFQPEGANGAFSLLQATEINAEFQTQSGTISKLPDFASFLDSSFLK